MKCKENNATGIRDALKENFRCTADLTLYRAISWQKGTRFFSPHALSPACSILQIDGKDKPEGIRGISRKMKEKLSQGD